MKFERKVFIKELFNAKDIFSKFAIINFKNFNAFLNFLSRNYFTLEITNNYIVNISSKKELDAFVQILQKTEIDKKNSLTIRYEDHLIDDVLNIPEDLNVELTADFSLVKKILNRESKLLDRVLHWTEHKIDANNYSEKFESILDMCLTDSRFNWIDLTFDYESFESKTISEFHSLYFFMKQLDLWTNQEALVKVKDGCNTTGKKIVLKNRDSCLKCWVDEKLDIYLNKEEMYFPMSKFLDKDGEQLDVLSLNLIRKIVDIKFIDTRFKNLYLIDLVQNQKIMGDHYRVPYITELIGEWLNA